MKKEKVEWGLPLLMVLAVIAILGIYFEPWEKLGREELKEDEPPVFMATGEKAKEWGFLPFVVVDEVEEDSHYIIVYKDEALGGVLTSSSRRVMFYKNKDFVLPQEMKEDEVFMGVAGGRAVWLVRELPPGSSFPILKLETKGGEKK